MPCPDTSNRSRNCRFATPRRRRSTTSSRAAVSSRTRCRRTAPRLRSPAGTGLPHPQPEAVWHSVRLANVQVPAHRFLREPYADVLSQWSNRSGCVRLPFRPQLHARPAARTKNKKYSHFSKCKQRLMLAEDGLAEYRQVVDETHHKLVEAILPYCLIPSAWMCSTVCILKP